MISKGTNAVLAAARARGLRLGGRRQGPHVLTSQEAKRSLATQAAQANNFAGDVALQIEELPAEGLRSLPQLANGVNKRGIGALRRRPPAVAWVSDRVR